MLFLKLLQNHRLYMIFQLSFILIKTPMLPCWREGTLEMFSNPQWSTPTAAKWQTWKLPYMVMSLSSHKTRHRALPLAVEGVEMGMIKRNVLPTKMASGETALSTTYLTREHIQPVPGWTQESSYSEGGIQAPAPQVSSYQPAPAAGWKDQGCL